MFLLILMFLLDNSSKPSDENKSTPQSVSIQKLQQRV